MKLNDNDFLNTLSDTTAALRAAAANQALRSEESRQDRGQPVLRALALESAEGLALALSYRGRVAFRTNTESAEIRQAAVWSTSFTEAVIRLVGRDRWSGNFGDGPIKPGRRLRKTALDKLLASHELTPLDERVLRNLREELDVSLIGPSASGKTSAGFYIARQFLQQQVGVTWLDFTDPDVDYASLLAELLRANWQRQQLVVLDNVQANPVQALILCKVIADLRDQLGIRMRVLMIGWPSARKLRSECLPDSVLIQAASDESARTILRSRGISVDVSASIAELAGGDLVVLTGAAEFYQTHHAIPTIGDVADIVASTAEMSKLVSGRSRQAFYWFACLGSYEIEVPRAMCRAIADDVLDDLVRRGLVRSDNGLYSVGHRSHSALAVYYAHRHWKSKRTGLDHPSFIALEFLRGAGDSVVRATLDKLDLLSLADGQSADRQGVFLARCWQAVAVLRRYLATQAQADPEWGRIVSSAAFACSTMARLEYAPEWRLSANFIRTSWDYLDSDALPSPAGDITVDWYDWPEIQKAMEAEDAVQRPPIGLATKDIDFIRFHRNWLIGILLTFEGNAIDRSQQRLDALVAMAEREQAPMGAFYPDRVPWVTARMLLGLAAAGHSYHTDETVRRACDWLRTPMPHGPYASGAWQVGTGSWNTSLLSTAIVIVALARCGVPSYDPFLRTGASYLRARRSDWDVPGKEIDTILVIEAMMLVEDDWQSLEGDLERLLDWARDSNAWANAGRPAYVSHDESCKLPFVVDGLVNAIWAIVKRELLVLLEEATSWSGLETLDAQAPATVPAWDTSRALSELTWLRDTIRRNISDRRQVLSTAALSTDSNVSQQLRLWEDRATVCDSLIAELRRTGVVSETLLLTFADLEVAVTGATRHRLAT